MSKKIITAILAIGLTGCKSQRTTQPAPVESTSGIGGDRRNALFVEVDTTTFLFRAFRYADPHVNCIVIHSSGGGGVSASCVPSAQLVAEVEQGATK